MAEWKKVVVSGSDISQLNNDLNYIADGDSGIALTGSFTGSFVGDGSNLTGLPAAAISSYTNPGNNRVITSVDSSTVNGEANLTFDGSALGVTGNITVTGTVDGVDVATLKSDFDTLEGKSLVSGSDQISASLFGDVSGDITIAADGTATIAADSVALGTDTTGDYVQSLGSGTGVTIGSNSGEGSQPTIAVDYGSNANEAVQGNTNITINGTANEIVINDTAAQALGGAPSYTIELADTIGGNRTFSGQTITFNNDITVQGTASFQNSTNLEVADQFILLNSGSTTDNSPGGIVIQQDTQDEGVAFAYDAAAYSNTGRWGVTSSFDASSTTFDADAYVAMVIDEDNGGNDITLYQQRGNIKIDTSDDIWIYT